MRIACINHKGGVGKSTTAVNLAVALAARGKTALLVDCDPQAHATRCVLADAGPERTVTDLLNDPPSRSHRTMTETPYENLWLIAAEHTLTNSHRGANPARVRREKRLRRALDALEANDGPGFDYVLRDSAPTESTLTHNVIGAVELLLIPVQTGGGAIEGVEPLLELAAEIHDSEEVPYRLLLTMYDSRTTVTNSAVVEQLRKHRRHMMRTVIPRSEPINQANLTSRPISAHHLNLGVPKRMTRSLERSSAFRDDAARASLQNPPMILGALDAARQNPLIGIISFFPIARHT